MAEHDDVVDLKAGDFVWYVRANEPRPRPAQILSDGICETQKLANGKLIQYAHLAYGTVDDTHVFLGHASAKPKPNDQDDRARAVAQRQSHETTAPWDPNGTPGTWHLPGECEQMAHPGTVPRAYDQRQRGGPIARGAGPRPEDQKRRDTISRDAPPDPDVQAP